MGKMFQAATNYLPAQVSGMMNQDRAFATVRLNISGQRNICALSTYVLTSVSHCQPAFRQTQLWMLTSTAVPVTLHPAEHTGYVCCQCVHAAVVFELVMLFSLGFRSCPDCW